MDTTTNYELKKPAYEDGADIQTLNGNSDIIDTALKSNSDLITEHKVDTNNPHQTTPEQIGAVQGNTKAWVATEVSTSLFADQWKLTIPNFAFSEGCQVTFKAPLDAAINYSTMEYFRININSDDDNGYVFRTLNHEILTGDEWHKGAMITVILSSEKAIEDRYTGTAFFKGGAPSVPSIFGTGADGDAVISGTVTLPVEVPHQSIVEKNYKSLIINAGAILKCASWNAGLILRVKGDCTIHGTIDQSGMAPKTNPQNNYPYPAQLVCGDGGNGGDGEDGSGGNGKSGGVGGIGMLKRPYGGGYGAGGGGTSSERDVGGKGGDSTNITVDVQNIFVGGVSTVDTSRNPYTYKSSPGTYGGGGSGAPAEGYDNGYYLGGNGGNGAGGTGGKGTSGYRTSGAGGGAGNYGGGVMLLYVGGDLLIDGSILCNGLNGGNGGITANYDHHAGNASGATPIQGCYKLMAVPLVPRVMPVPQAASAPLP